MIYTNITYSYLHRWLFMVNSVFWQLLAAFGCLRRLQACICLCLLVWFFVAFAAFMAFVAFVALAMRGFCGCDACGFLALWLLRLWRCVALWGFCGCGGVRFCDCVAVWLGGFITLWLCVIPCDSSGFVALWHGGFMLWWLSNFVTLVLSGGCALVACGFRCCCGVAL